MTKTLRLLSLAAVLTTGAASATLAAPSDTGVTTNQPTSAAPMTTPPGTVVTTANPHPNQQSAHSPGQPNLALPGAGTGKGPSTDAGTKQ
jgi:hypothetical protein